ncbi:MAG TPA: 2-oxoacid:acceptor oxidoreductase family protein, partial [Xanthomonadales bacterium]|nr:2-oxoacid:acceptor oxidoreductase family protein [Xanthomonadales bacterium]
MSKAAKKETKTIEVSEHTVEIITNSGEGAQKCAQIFGQTCAKMGNGVWTVEIIPAEIEPPHHTVTSTSGNIIRFGKGMVTNWGDQSKLAIAFNEQVLLSRHRLDSLDDNCIILQESMWETHEDEQIRKVYEEAMEEMSSRNYRFISVPIEEEALKIVDNPSHGKNMFALGMLAEIYQRDLSIIENQIAHIFRFKSQKVIDLNIELVKSGMAWARGNLDFRFAIPSEPLQEERLVMNGNQACALGAIAETFRTVVIVLTDANLATGVQQFTRPELDVRWQQGPIDQSP